jgi:hypothetical protein
MSRIQIHDLTASQGSLFYELSDQEVMSISGGFLGGSFLVRLVQYIACLQECVEQQRAITAEDSSCHCKY